ncbi:SDR family oxidoreductase [Longispora sp. K20-0274]|uniref:SDR family oxidoreductase n=1 Tax=Longispora sp. K20-0274 TaxID=3088255 RepID=UPI00399ABE50
MILVTGATGNVGRQVVAQLLEAGEKVRAISRDPATAGLPDGVEVLEGDLRRPETLPAALRDVDRVYLFPVHGALDDFLAAARDAGVGRIVLLSSMAVNFEHSNDIARWHAECEQSVRDSGLAWTFLRPGAFMANDLAWGHSIRAEGVVRAAYGDAASAPIDERDIAEVAVRALLDEGHAGEAYTLTGPASLTQVDRVRIIGEVLGRELRFEELTPEAARAHLDQFLPPGIAEVLVGLLAATAGTTAEVEPAFERITGRAGGTYARWVARRAAEFR